MGWSLFAAEERSPLASGKQEDGTDKTVEEALECDYERDCTTLYKKIEDEEFEDVLRFLSSGYWPGAFFADGTSPVDQARTWVTRFDPKDDKKVRWSQLPVHLAIVVDAPLAILRQLLELYPQAIRCTDDQHMLPLHLALRHGSPDKVIDHLLALFPESVNARGKNERTAVEIAKRGPNKVRGRILEVFLKYTKNKTKYSSDWYIKEMATLKEELAVKNSELDDTKSKLIGLEAAKVATELGLRGKIDELEVINKDLSYASTRKVEDIESDKILEVFEANKRVDQLEKALAASQDIEKRARESEKLVQTDLQMLNKRISNASPSELTVIKKELTKMRILRLKETKKMTKQDVDALDCQLSEDIQTASDKSKKEELLSIKSTVGELRSLGAKAKSFDDLVSVREGIDSVRSGLRAKEDTAKTQEDLEKLKQTLEKGLKDVDEKHKHEMESMKKTVDSIGANQIESKTNEELQSLKTELASLRKDVRDKELLVKTKKHYETLKSDIESHIAESQGKTQQELAEMKKSVEKINIDRLETKADGELIEVKKELASIREQLDEKEEASRTRLELTILRKALEAELKDKEGKTQEELNSIKEAVATMNTRDLDSRTNKELSKLKSDLATVKDQLKMKEDAQATITELETVKLTLKEQMKESDARTKRELSAMKKSVDAIDPKQVEKVNREELDTLQAELTTVRDQLQTNEDTKALLKDLQAMRSSLMYMMKSGGKTPEESEAMKSSIKSIGDKELEGKTTAELRFLSTEIQTLKVELQRREEVSRDLSIAMQSIEKQAHVQHCESPALASLKSKAAEIENRSAAASPKEMKDIKNDAITLKIQALAAEAEQNVQYQKAMISEITDIKTSLEKDMADAGGRGSKETVHIERALSAIDTKTLKEKSFTELEILLREVQELKANGIAAVPKKKKSLKKIIVNALGLNKKTRKAPVEESPNVSTIGPPRITELSSRQIGASDSLMADSVATSAADNNCDALPRLLSQNLSVASSHFSAADDEHDQGDEVGRESSTRSSKSSGKSPRSFRGTRSNIEASNVKSIASLRSVKSEAKSTSSDVVPLECAEETTSTSSRKLRRAKQTKASEVSSAEVKSVRSSKSGLSTKSVKSYNSGKSAKSSKSSTSATSGKSGKSFSSRKSSILSLRGKSMTTSAVSGAKEIASDTSNSSSNHSRVGTQVPVVTESGDVELETHLATAGSNDEISAKPDQSVVSF